MEVWKIGLKAKAQFGKSDLVAEIPHPKSHIRNPILVFGFHLSFPQILGIHQLYPLTHFLLDHFEMVLFLRGDQRNGFSLQSRPSSSTDTVDVIFGRSW